MDDYRFTAPLEADDYPFTSPAEAGLQAALSRPIGWDQVFDWDTCDCVKDGLHQPNCIYYGWLQ